MSSSMEQKLRDQARRMLPAISEELHARTLQALQHAPASQPQPTQPAHWQHLGMAIAAMLALAVGIWHLLPVTTLPPTPQPNQPQLASSLNIPVPGSSDLLQTIDLVDPTPLLHLQQDAQSVARYLLDQLPQSVPNGQKI